MPDTHDEIPEVVDVFLPEKGIKVKRVSKIINEVVSVGETAMEPAFLGEHLDWPFSEWLEQPLN